MFFKEKEKPNSSAAKTLSGVGRSPSQGVSMKNASNWLDNQTGYRSRANDKVFIKPDPKDIPSNEELVKMVKSSRPAVVWGLEAMRSDVFDPETGKVESPKAGGMRISATFTSAKMAEDALKAAGVRFRRGLGNNMETHQYWADDSDKLELIGAEAREGRLVIDADLQNISPGGSSHKAEERPKASSVEFKTNHSESAQSHKRHPEYPDLRGFNAQPRMSGVEVSANKFDRVPLSGRSMNVVKYTDDVENDPEFEGLVTLEADHFLGIW